MTFGYEETLSFRLSKKQVAELKKLAEEKAVKVASLVRILIIQFLRQNGSL